MQRGREGKNGSKIQKLRVLETRSQVTKIHCGPYGGSVRTALAAFEPKIWCTVVLHANDSRRPVCQRFVLQEGIFSDL